jgi:Lon-like ATP-dependent protease
VGEIAHNAIRKIGFPENKLAVEVVKRYATNGREAVNVIQLAAGIALTDNRTELTAADVEWVVNSSQISPRPERKVPNEPRVGFVNGLAVYGPNQGLLLEIEVIASPTDRSGKGSITITGVVDEEEISGGSRTIRRKSMARGSVENVLTVLKRLGLKPGNFDLHINFPGGTPIDGPSAGISMATAIASAIRQIPVDNKLAMTGELSIHGKVKPIGGIVAKVEAAFQAGVTRVIIPRDNWQDIFADIAGVQVIAVDSVEEVLEIALGSLNKESLLHIVSPVDTLVAAPAARELVF